MSCTLHLLCVHQVPIFHGLDEPTFQHIEEIVQPREYYKGTRVFLQGTRSEALYIVQKGFVKLYKLSPDGKEQTLRILFPRDFFGQSALIENNPHYLNALTLQDAKICTIYKQDFQRILKEDHALTLHLLTAVNQRLHEADEWLSSMSLHEVERRLTKLILLFESKLIQGDPYFKLLLQNKN